MTLPLVEINIDPIIAHIGPFPLRWYSLMIMLGVWAATMAAARFAQDRGLDSDHVFNAAVWVVLFGIAGARIAHVIDRWDLYRSDPIRVFAINEGGIAILGGLIAGGVGVWAYARVNDLPFWKFGDAVCHGAILGQAIGRVGCIVNGDVAGRPTDGDWGFVYVHPGAILPKASYFGIPTHPYPLYELVWDLALFAILFVIAKRVRIDGAVFVAYTAFYSLGRLVLTTVREESIWIGGLQQAQVVSLATICLAIGVFVYRARVTGTTIEISVAGGP